MSIYQFYNTDPGAPSLDGTSGSLIALFDACLVDGYQDTPPAGWTKSFSATNKAVYQAASGNRRYLRVLDDGSCSDNAMGARVAWARAYETMSDIDTGVYPFPSDSAANLKGTSGNYIYKSSELSSVSRQWALIADDRFFYFFAEINPAYPGRYLPFYFGDGVSYVPVDQYFSLIATNYANNITADPAGSYLASCNAFTSFEYAHNTSFILHADRNYSGAKLSPRVALTLDSPLIYLDSAIGGQGCWGAYINPMEYPDPATGGLWVGQPRVIGNTDSASEQKNIIRGLMPGLFVPYHNAPLSHRQTVTGLTGLADRTLIAINCATYRGQGQALFDITGPWR